jgi:quercetin dioxygenase-like cupin family protein
VTDAWRVRDLPAENGDFVDPCTKVELEPESAGNVVRIVSFAPESEWMEGADIARGYDMLGETGTEALAAYEGAPHPTMHQTNTLDYIIVIKGEVYAVMENGETLLKHGDVLIQRGTNHAWSNRSTAPCIVAAILNGAKPLARRGAE